MKSVRNIFTFVLTVAILCNSFFSVLTINAEDFVSNIYISGKLKEPLAENCGYGFSFFNRTVYSGCYGNQLTGDAKGIYDTFVEEYVTKRGCSEIEYNLETPLTFKDKYINGDLVGSEEYYEANDTAKMLSQIAFDAFIYDHPEVFWLKTVGYYSLISISFDSDGNADCMIETLCFVPEETYYGASGEIKKYDSAVDSLVATIENRFDESSSRKEVLKYLHDYLCESGYYSNSSDRIVHTSEPIFLGDGGVVCEGYADAFKVICDRLGIPCACIVGMADNGQKTEGHMWNYVQLEDGKWYLVDITWDDQISNIYYTYFLANYNSNGYNSKIFEERQEMGDFSGSGYKSFIFPPLSQTECPEVKHLVQIRNRILDDIWDEETCLDFNEDDQTDARDIVWLKKVLADMI